MNNINWNDRVRPRGRPEFLVDEATEGQSVPAYAYAFNNPTAYADPDGLQPLPYDPACKSICEDDRNKAQNELKKRGQGGTCTLTGWASVYGLQPPSGKKKNILKYGLVGCACGGFIVGAPPSPVNPLAWFSFAAAP